MDRIKTKIAYLSENELFHGIPRQELKEIECRLAMTTCEKGRVFFMPSETPDVLFVLKEGRVQLYRLSPEGKKFIIDVLEPGTVFGEMSVIGQGLQNTFAEAVEPCVLCVMSRQDVEMLLREHPSISRHLLEIVGRRAMELEQRVAELSFLDVTRRVASLLWRMYEKSGSVKGYSHQDIADLVGTYRETVTQTLNQLKQQGLIDIQRKEIRILDPAGLRELATSAEEPTAISKI